MAEGESSTNVESSLPEKIKENSSGAGNDAVALNGISNGVEKEKKRDKEHKSEHRDKHKSEHRDKDKHREKDKDRHRDKDKDRHRDKDKERHSSSHSSSKDKDKHSSSSSSKDKDKHSSSSSSKDKHHSSSSSSKDKHSSSSSSRDKEKEKSSSSSSKDKHSSSSSSKDKDKDKDRSKHSSSSSSRDKDKDKHHSSSSSSKDKDKHRSDKDKHRSSDKDKDRHRSDKDKHRSDRDKDRSKHSSSKDKDKEREKDRIKEEKAVKQEADDGGVVQNHILEESAAESADDTVVSQQNGTGVKSEYEDDEMEVSMDRAPPTPSYEVKVEEDEDEEEYKPEVKVEENEESEEELPLQRTFDRMAARAQQKRKQEDTEEDSDDDVPLTARKKPKKEVKQEKKSKKRRKQESEEEEDDEEFYEEKKKKKSSVKNKTKTEAVTPEKKKKVKEEEGEVWKWWEEKKVNDGRKWTYLEHKGPIFAPPYERLPSSIKFYYNGQEMKLSQDAEEIATFYARMIEHEYTTKEAFNTNFMKDWRKSMTEKERSVITDLSKCDFRKMHAYFVQKSEERKAMSKEEKKKIKEDNDALTTEYGTCKIDGHNEKIGNFRIEPPGLFRGRGEHPKMGKLKRRIQAEDITINCSKDSKIPPPPPGHKWKEVRHDNQVTWLASWTENVQGQIKYIMLNPSSKLKGEKDWQKYETARKLALSIDKIRENYQADLKSKEMRIRQRAVALYFIDKLALRAGNEKDEDQADTVGCCSLRVEHIQLHEEKDGKPYVVVFDFLGKDSIRYYNEVPVEKRVFKNLQLFVENKKGTDDLFDRLNTQVLNKHLSELMEGLTAKVFRTYNASITLQQQLDELTDPDYSEAEMILAYNRANRAVAVLCNHQRSVPKSHDKSMGNLKEKIQTKKKQVKEAERSFKDAKKGGESKVMVDKKKTALDRLKSQLLKLEVQETDKEENKTIALGTSKLNYLDPRISVAWCKKYNVPIEKIYNKTQRAKFRWAIDMAGPDYVFVATKKKKKKHNSDDENED
uniref:DNA topoisomerase I n=1 Tax=Cacopsylla melanoneura TaxID=428564 RepID=A0A8D9F3T9_9HEMI